MLLEEIKIISREEVQNFILTNENEDEKKLLFRKKEIFGLRTHLIATQIAARRKAKIKLPSFYQTKGIVYPPSLNLEQSSSETTAKFKAQILQKEFGQKKIKLADLTCGFGTDTFFLNQIAESIDSVEPDGEVLAIAKHNYSMLGKNHIHLHAGGAEEFLKRSSNQFDLIYLDPSRRTSQNKKTFLLKDCEPNVQNLLPVLFDRTDFILLKTSPLLDIHQGIKELSDVKKVMIVSVANECKEVLFLLQKNSSDEPIIETFNLENNGTIKHYFDFKLSDEAKEISLFNSPQAFLYEPNSSILKSGAFKLIGRKFELQKIHPNTHLYTSNKLEQDFPGRIFQIENLKFDPKTLTEKKANIIARNYPLRPEEIRKKFKLADGGENYVIAFSSKEKKYIVSAKRMA